MPFVKRTIEPIRIGLNGGTVTECKNELQQVTAISLVDVMRQLSSLSLHVQDMFGELHREAALLLERTFRLNEKVEYLRSEIGQLNPIVEEVSLQDINLRNPFKFSNLKDQQIITHSTRPFCISAVYASCEPPPCLQKLNSCRSDGKDSLRFYTDPGYFFELWCQAMQRESKTQLKRHKKSKKSNTIGKQADENQKWAYEKVQSKGKDGVNLNKIPSTEQQKQPHKISSTQTEQVANKANEKHKPPPLKLPSQKPQAKTESNAKQQDKIIEVTDQTLRKFEQCAKECQTPEENVGQQEISTKIKSEPFANENSKQNCLIIPENLNKFVKRQSEKLENCTGVLDLSHRTQNLYENASTLISKENTYENTLALLSEYNRESSEADDKKEEDGETKSVVKRESSPVNLSLKLEGDQNGAKDVNKNVLDSTDHEGVANDAPGFGQPDQATSVIKPSSSPLPGPHQSSNKTKMLNLPPAPPTPPELYEGVHFPVNISQMLEDVQKKTAAFREGLASEMSDVADGEEKIINEMDFSDLSDLPPIPSPPKFPPFMEVSSTSSPSPFPSPPAAPAYNQHQSPTLLQFADIKESLSPSNKMDIVSETVVAKQGDETSLTSEVSVVSSESEYSVMNSHILDAENSSGVIRDTRCDLLAAIREGIQLRKVEECRQKTECKPAGRLDVQSIMEVAFEMRRKMLEEDESEEDEEDFETNWSDED